MSDARCGWVKLGRAVQSESCDWAKCILYIYTYIYTHTYTYIYIVYSVCIYIIYTFKSVGDIAFLL